MTTETHQQALGTARRHSSTAGTLKALLISMRPQQWTKNLIVFAAVIFSGDLDHAMRLVDVAAAFVLFCVLSGCGYLINDARDLERDRLHERKRSRPMAAGELSPQLAAAVATVGVAAALAGSFALDPGFAAVAAGYLALQLLYSFWLKEMVILDAMAIAGCFVLRVTAGAVVIDVSLSPWIVLCTALLALFLAFAKRRHELLMVEGAVDHRPALEHYSESFLDTMIATVTAATIVFYSMYTFWAHEGHQRAYMMLSVPFVAYGLFRYLYLMHMKDLGGSPETVLLTDVPLILDIVLWVATVVAVLYFT